ncbi:hypothetical protein BVI1335_1140060 [Burkholderia vietnamiensis]|nr:hypothetical protein BVI1335_1140060 [Burkholderia vietnamiensis]
MRAIGADAARTGRRECGAQITHPACFPAFDSFNN